MPAGTFELSLVTPEKVVLAATVAGVQAPGIDGSFGILGGHAPYMTALVPGVIRVRHVNGDMELVATGGGFMEVNNDKVIILADTADRAVDIDVAMAEEAIASARALLQSGDVVDLAATSRNLQRATAQLDAVKQLNRG